MLSLGDLGSWEQDPEEVEASLLTLVGLSPLERERERERMNNGCTNDKMHTSKRDGKCNYSIEEDCTTHTHMHTQLTLYLLPSLRGLQ